MSGDLKSVVLHSMTLASVKSDFDVPVGVKISGVDNSTFSLTGEAYSAIGLLF
jgi:orotate phosphoribosyltransferase-like protein